MTSYQKKLQPVLPKNTEMHLRGPPFSFNVVATMGMGMMDLVDAVDIVEVVEPETGMTGSAPDLKMAYIVHMHADNTNVLGREGGNNGKDERSCFLCGLPGHVNVVCISYQRSKEWRRVKKATPTDALTMTRHHDLF
jgi:hypothetical protein